MNYREKMIAEKLKFARAISGGTIEGKTEASAGHTHRFAVAFIDEMDMFIGETSRDGQAGHKHYFAVSVYDVVNEYGADQLLNEEEIVVDANSANLPANIRSILDFYNLTEIRLESTPSFPNEHTHVTVVRYADGGIDKMGRKVTATQFTEGLRKAGGSSKID